MKILILTEGGKNIGFGHLTRCLSLYQAFKERGITPELLVNGDDSVIDLLKGNKYRILNWLREGKKLFEVVDKTDIVIIDSYLAEKSLYDRISKITGNRIFMIDDYNRLEYPGGIVINPSIYGEKINYPQKDGIIYLLGKDYIILRKEFWKIPKKVINKEVKNILVTFGGIDHYELAHRIIKFLEDKFCFNFHLVELQKDKFNAKKMLALMVKTDICISGGGQTIYELAGVGVPTFGICFADNQLLNLRGWTKEGFLKFAGWFNDKNLYYKIKNFILQMDYETRLKMSKIGQKFIDGQGARRVVREILNFKL